MLSSLFHTLLILAISLAPGLFIYQALFKFVSGKSLKSPSIFFSVTTGFLFFNFILSQAYLFLPLSHHFWYLFLLMGVAGTILQMSKLKQLLADRMIFYHKNRYFLLTALLFVCAFCVVGAMKNRYPSDDDGYYYQSMLWMKAYPVVNGIGNLYDHIAIGIGQAWFKLGLVFAQSPFSGNSLTHDDLNVAFLLAFGLHVLRKLKYDRNLIMSAGLMLCLPFVFNSLKSFTADLPVTILGLTILGLYHRLNTRAFNHFRFNLMLMLCIYSISIKFSSIFILIFPLHILVKKRALINFNISKYLSVLGYGFMTIFCLCLTNHFSSGYFLYPMTDFLSMPCDWAMTKTHLKDLTESIRNWPKLRYFLARQEPVPEGFLDHFHWFRFWFKELSAGHKILFLNIFFPVLFFSRLKKESREFYLLLICAFLCWFFTCPNIRFGHYFFIATFVLSFHFFCEWLMQKRLPLIKWSTLGIICMILISQTVLNFRPAYVFEQEKQRSFESQKVKVNEIEINQPVLSPDVYPKQCGCTEIPCSFKYPQNLRMRSTNLKDGFSITVP